MRYILLYLLLFTTLVCCGYNKKNIETKESVTEDYYNTLSNLDVIFVLGTYDLKDYSDLDQFSTSDESISEKLDLDKIIYNKASIKIKYLYSLNGINLKEAFFVLNSDNNKNFTLREFLFKINQMSFD